MWIFIVIFTYSLFAEIRDELFSREYDLELIFETHLAVFKHTYTYTNCGLYQNYTAYNIQRIMSYSINGGDEWGDANLVRNNREY